ncbi:hypothetical protein M3Y96_00201900 [Aphelenchoides besseyi]|nr:hypothetical protein M3Y96_00201900 [Aphelenchoides besseyi]
MSSLKGSWLVNTSILLVVLLSSFVGTSGQDVKWVPIVERRSETTNEIEAAFQKTWHTDQITSEKVARIGKMLNNSLDTQKQEIKEGRQKLDELQQATSTASRLLPFTFLLVSFAVYNQR